MKKTLLNLPSLLIKGEEGQWQKRQQRGNTLKCLLLRRQWWLRSQSTEPMKQSCNFTGPVECCRVSAWKSPVGGCTIVQLNSLSGNPMNEAQSPNKRTNILWTNHSYKLNYRLPFKPWSAPAITLGWTLCLSHHLLELSSELSQHVAGTQIMKEPKCVKRRPDVVPSFWTSTALLI